MLSVTPRSLSAAERLDWLRLVRSENVGPVTFLQLLERFGDAGAALDALPELARRGGRDGRLRVADKAAAEREIEGLAAIGGRFIALGEDEYPLALAAIADPPPLIAVRGHPNLFQRPLFAIVGARNASANGRRFAQSIARELGKAGLAIVSGLARGIDAAAHEGSFESGTVAVVAGGIDMVYPSENAALYERIVEQGVVVAEEPLGTPPQGRLFPKRNRVISGCSLGVLVVEAAQRSGSVITARCALEQGREVFAVPGSPLDPRSQGTNNLIRNGAKLTESADDIMDELKGMIRQRAGEKARPPFAGPRPAIEERALESARARVVESLGPAPVQVDEIVRQCQLSPAVVAAVLLELELAGRLDRLPGHQVCLVSGQA